jgi:hypothetical protein
MMELQACRMLVETAPHAPTTRLLDERFLHLPSTPGNPLGVASRAPVASALEEQELGLAMASAGTDETLLAGGERLRSKAGVEMPAG